MGAWRQQKPHEILGPLGNADSNQFSNDHLDDSKGGNFDLSGSKNVRIGINVQTDQESITVPDL